MNLSKNVYHNSLIIGVINEVSDMSRTLVVLVLCVLLTGCSITKTQENETVNQEETDVARIDVQAKEQDAYILPDWLESYAYLGELPNPTYLSREGNKFSADDNIRFPESNILFITKDIAESSRALINCDNKSVIAFVEEIEKAGVISEEDAINPDAKLLGYSISIVILTVDGVYNLVNISAFDDGRINVTIEQGENYQSVWIKSLELVDKMKQLVGYEDFNVEQVNSLTNVVIIDSENNQYSLLETDIDRMQKLLSNAKQVTGDSKCPFDVSMEFTMNSEEIQAKYCHDSCGVLIIQGKYYSLNRQDAEWLAKLVDGYISY